MPDRRRRRRRLDDRPARPARPRLDRRYRRAARRGGVRALRGAALVRAGRLRRRRRVRARRHRDLRRGEPRLLPRDPTVPLRSGRPGARGGRPDEERADRRREAVRPRRRVRPRARRGAAPVHRGVAASPHRPLPREDGPRRDPLPAVREPDLRAGLEPGPHRVRRDHDGGGLRRRGSRPLLRPRRRAARRRRQPPDAGRRRDGDGAAVPRRPDDDQGLAGGAVPRGAGGGPRPLRPRAVRGLPRDRRRRRRLDDRDVRGAPPGDRELALVGRAVLHPHREAPASDADRGSRRLQASAAARLRDRLLRAQPDRRQARPLDGDQGDPRGAPGRCPGRLPDRARHGVRRPRAARAQRRTRCSSTPRWSATPRASPGRTASRRQWRIMQPLLDAPPPVHAYAPGSWGPEAADKLVAGFGRWHGPWLAS